MQKFSSCLLRVFLRTYLVSAAYNMRGLQNIGFIYAMDPGLAAVHKDPAALHEARGRYVRHYNCHPFWTPFLAGIFLNVESDISQGRLPSVSFAAVKDTATYSMSALGDSVFGGTFLVTWALICISLTMADCGEAALAFSALLFVGLQFFKISTFIAGLRFGLSSLAWLRRWDLINWGDKFKVVNALLLALIFAQNLPADSSPVPWAATAACAMAAARLCVRLHTPRTLFAFLAAATLLLISYP